MPEEPTQNQTALVVDDDVTNLMVLSRFLEKLGYDVVQAENGKLAIDSFKEHTPDIVFMDVMMPEMNGYEATTQIKYLCGNHFVPVIFLTALNDPEDFAKCIDSGGDDFLSKPIELTILKAKIHAIERNRNLYRKVQELNSTLKDADLIANKVFQQAIFSKNLQIDAIKTWFKSSEEFNNDLFLIAHTPSNGINILFGHFNTKGLASAVGALPASEVFRTMSKKGFAPHNIVQKINAKLYDLLPNGISLSMVFINIDEDIKQALICNYNMPEVQFVNQLEGNIYYQLKPRTDSIGATPRFSRSIELERVNINEHTHIVLGNGEIFNCKNTERKSFCRENFIDSVIKGSANSDILNTIKQDIIRFLANEDINNLSLVEIPCSSKIIPERKNFEKELHSNNTNTSVHHTLTGKDHIEFNLNISGSNLKIIDPIPTLLNNLETIVNIDKQQEILFTILTELYINALDHGVLKLKSSLKESEEGFAKYYQIREEKIQNLKEGYIRIGMYFISSPDSKKLNIKVEDSGNGFDTTLLDNNIPAENVFSGRGIKLLKNLCENISFNEKGNFIEVTYSWN